MHNPQAHQQTTGTSIAATTNRKSDALTQPKPDKITRKVRAAIDAMVWQGLPRAEAATAAGMREHSLYKALRKPPVKAAYLRELDVLRTSERARNFHALLAVRDQTDNQQARVNAVKVLEEQDVGGERKAAATTPGITIVIVGDNAKAAVQVNHTQSPDPVCRDDDGGDR